MIQIITIGPSHIPDEFSDESGLLDRFEFDPAAIPEALPLFPPAPDLIYIRPDWPPIGSPEFAEKLRAWHAEHNSALVKPKHNEFCNVYLGLPCDCDAEAIP